MQRVWETCGADETRDLGRRLAQAAKPGEVYALSGDLGVGKTVFAKGFAEGLGIREAVTSPTFTILQIYEKGRLPLCHMDTYRLEDEEELEAIGGEEYLGSPWVTLIEWPERVWELLPPGCFTICIEKDPGRGTDYRRITFSREETHENTGH